MEILLSFIEFTQFQQYLYGHLEVADDDELNNVTLLKFPSNIPMSEIIEDDEGKEMNQEMNNDKEAQTEIEMDPRNGLFLNACKVKAHKLHNKYIKGIKVLFLYQFKLKAYKLYLKYFVDAS